LSKHNLTPEDIKEAEDAMESVMAATLAALLDLHNYLGQGLVLQMDTGSDWQLVDRLGEEVTSEHIVAMLGLLQGNAERFEQCCELVDAQDAGAIQ
jgi:hypothetical protein